MIVIIIIIHNNHNNHNNPHLKLSYYSLNYSISSSSFFLFFFLFRQSHRVFFPPIPCWGGKKEKKKKGRFSVWVSVVPAMGLSTFFIYLWGDWTFGGENQPFFPCSFPFPFPFFSFFLISLSVRAPFIFYFCPKTILIKMGSPSFFPQKIIIRYYYYY